MESTKIRVLYVDDEINNLISFKANFREFYEIFTAESAKEGIEILKKKNVHVVITDQRMPHTSGVQFLASIIKDYPCPIRIILTGYTDIETVIEAINKGQIYNYILKPFNIEELKTIIENAYDLYLFRKSDKDSLLKFRQLFENFNAAIFIMGFGGNFQELNNFGLNLFKIQRSKLHEITLQTLFNNSTDYKDIHTKITKKEIIIDYPAKLKDSKNSIVESLITAIPIPDKENFIGYQCMIRDITKQKEMENIVIKTIIETQEIERLKLSKNLHDSIGHSLAALKLFLMELEKKEEFLKGNEILAKANETIALSIEELRTICFWIMPATFELLGLKATISQLGKRNELSGLFKYKFFVDEDFPKLDLQLELTIFRIIQVFVSNTMLHSEAKKIEIILTCLSDKIQLILKDDGKGFDVKKSAVGPGMGLKNIRSRIQSYNGEIEMKSVLNKGTEFTIRLPLNR